MYTFIYKMFILYLCICDVINISIFVSFLKDLVTYRITQTQFIQADRQNIAISKKIKNTRG